MKILVIVALAAVIAAAAYTTTNSFQKTHAVVGRFVPQAKAPIVPLAAPIATSGDNVYIAWPSNKTGNDEVMFKASTDSGKTFGNKMNLSNSPKSESQDVQIAAAGNNVYVTWWERNRTMNEPILRVSNDNGKTFGEKIMLSSK
jgi:uncharacterized protein (UPF0333 family)